MPTANLDNFLHSWGLDSELHGARENNFEITLEELSTCKKSISHLPQISVHHILIFIIDLHYTYMHKWSLPC